MTFVCCPVGGSDSYSPSSNARHPPCTTEPTIPHLPPPRLEYKITVKDGKRQPASVTSRRFTWMVVNQAMRVSLLMTLYWALDNLAILQPSSGNNGWMLNPMDYTIVRYVWPVTEASPGKSTPATSHQAPNTKHQTPTSLPHSCFTRAPSRRNSFVTPTFTAHLPPQTPSCVPCRLSGTLSVSTPKCG